MSRDDTYNGWPNRETWAAHLWITNDEGLYTRVRGMSADDMREVFDMFHVECFDDETLTMLLDIGSLWRVDWDAIAKALSE